MWEEFKSFQFKLKTVLYFAAILILLAGVTPVLADYLGPDRTVTQSGGSCKVVLATCRYVAAKGIWKYKNGSSWSCSNESKPWQAYPSSSRSCSSANAGYTYWKRIDDSGDETITYPPATIDGSLQNCTLNNGWCTTSPQLFLNAVEPLSGHEIIAIEGTLNGQNFACPDSDCSVPLAEGDNALTYWALSSWGDSSTMGSMTVKVDSQLPVISGAFSGTAGSNGWYLSPVSFIGSAADATSGLASFTCTLDGIALGSCTSISVNDEGPHTLVLTALDNAGNSGVVTQNVSIDSQNPALNSALQGTLGSNSWYNDAELHATASDPTPGSGLSALEYSIDSAGWVAFPSSGVLQLPEGKHSVDIHVIDNAGHSVSSSKSFWLDSLAPDLVLNPQGTLGTNDWYVTSLNLAASASDDTSGVDILEYTHNSSTWTTYTTPLVLNDGTHTISFWAQDKAGLVTQVDRIYQVDTVHPQIAGSLSGTPGANGWYVSNVILSASAADPLPGSGVDAFTYILDGSAETPYTTALTIPDGLHTIRLNVQDRAGLTYFTEQSMKVDTISPTVSIQTTLPNWIKGNVTLNGSAADGGSGISKVEISTNGGQSWQTTNGTTSWSYDWDTFGDSNGSHNVIVRAADQAGLLTQQVLNTAVDNRAPNIVLPESWLQWQAANLDIWDDGSGLSEARLEIHDPDKRWPRRVIQLDTSDFPIRFKWDRRFGDGTIAPNGTYTVLVTAIDQLGNVSQKYASVKILIDILPAGPTATPEAYNRMIPTPGSTLTPVPTLLPAMTPTTVVSVFGEIQPTAQTTSTPEVASSPRATPTQTGVLEWLESVFIPQTDATNQITELETSTSLSAETSASASESGVLWGAAAAAMVGAVTSYALEEKRKREQKPVKKSAREQQEKPRAIRAGEAASEERRSKIRARKMQKLEEKWAQEEAQDKDFATRGASAKIDREDQKAAVAWIAQLKASNQQKAEERKRAEEQKKADERQVQLEAYYARQQEAAASESNWWEKTKSFIGTNILEPWDQYIYKPIVQPVIERRNEVLASTASWLNENVYQPYIAPVVDNRLEQLKNNISWANEKIIQPWVIPFGKEVVGVVSDIASWANTVIVEPYVAPFVSKAVEYAVDGVAWLNESVYQPHILPALQKFNENTYQPYLAPFVDSVMDGFSEFKELVNEQIYEPIFAPVVNDINKYIVKPYVDPAIAWWDKTWDEYGEWVHNSLDAVGFIPGLGDIMDGVNGVIYFAEGRYLEASISAIAMLPVLGDLAKAGKLGLKVGAEIVEEVGEKVVKEVFEEVAEKSAKELGEELAEKAATETTEELVEKTAKDGLENAAEKATKEAAEDLSSKVIAESAENTAAKALKEEAVDNAVQKVADDAAAKVAKNTTEVIASSSAKQLSKEAKEKLVQQALEQADDKTASLVRSVAENLGDEFASINKAVALVQKYGDDAVKALKAVEPEAAAKVLRTVDENILDDVVRQGSDAFAAFSGWTEKELKDHGKDLAARATKDAEVLNDVKTLVSKGPIDPKNLTDEQKLLIEKIAANSTFTADGKQVVVGKWVGLDGGFLKRARETGSLHYSPHPDLWGLFKGLENQNEAAWLINEEVIQKGIGKGLPFEYTLDGIPAKDIVNERAAIKAIFSGQTEEIIKKKLKSDYLPVRLRELQELKNAGFDLTFDEINNSYILMKP